MDELRGAVVKLPVDGVRCRATAKFPAFRLPLGDSVLPLSVSSRSRGYRTGIVWKPALERAEAEGLSKEVKLGVKR
jgi:hypothetical protein